jgi:hypothetical protein
MMAMYGGRGCAIATGQIEPSGVLPDIGARGPSGRVVAMIGVAEDIRPIKSRSVRPRKPQSIPGIGITWLCCAASCCACSWQNCVDMEGHCA